MPADDSIFEKALERQMRKRPVEGTDGGAHGEPCPDAELLAAYHERSLSDEEMILWKEHIASCGRCQEVLVALETTEEISLGERADELAGVMDVVGGVFGSPVGAATPKAAQKVVPLLRMSGTPADLTSAPAAQAASKKQNTRRYWVVAASAIAAAVVLYVGVAMRRTQEAIETARIAERAKTEEAAKPGMASEPQLSAQNVPSKDLSTQPLREVTPSVRERNQKMPGQAGKVDSAAATPDSLQTERREDSPRKLKGLTGLAPLRAARTNNSGQGAGSGAGVAGSSLAAAASPPPPALRDADAEDAKKSATGAASETITVVNEAPPVPVGPASQSVAVSSEKPAAAPSQNKDEAVAATTTVEVQSLHHAKAIGGSLELSKERDSHLIAAPGGNVVWRVGAAGAIEQSTNAGATWAKQTSGVTDKTLHSGSAPSEAVCWVVGSAGTILRTVDGGGHWTAVVSPLGPGAKKGELGGVLGVDAMHATVWDARNTRQFATSDGGESWVRVEKQQK